MCGSLGYQEVDLFSEIRGRPQPDFDSVFGGSGGPPASSMGVVQGTTSTQSVMGGGVLTPEAVGPHASLQQSAGAQGAPGLTTDVESSLVRAAENLCECLCVCVCVWCGCDLWDVLFSSAGVRRQNRNDEKVS